jgi:hypothetical protein
MVTPCGSSPSSFFTAFPTVSSTQSADSMLIGHPLPRSLRFQSGLHCSMTSLPWLYHPCEVWPQCAELQLAKVHSKVSESRHNSPSAVNHDGA